jgi:hypothetical protein
MGAELVGEKDRFEKCTSCLGLGTDHESVSDSGTAGDALRFDTRIYNQRPAPPSCPARKSPPGRPSEVWLALEAKTGRWLAKALGDRAGPSGIWSKKKVVRGRLYQDRTMVPTHTASCRLECPARERKPSDLSVPASHL